MIKSMTAYARAENQTAPFTVRVEVRSYNSRHLDVALKLTHGFESLEERIKGVIADTVARGRVDIRVRIQDESEAGIGFEVNLPRARAYFEALNALNDSLGLKAPIAIERSWRRAAWSRRSRWKRTWMPYGPNWNRA
jgi:uncharacterized protein (TIGR00255 family)